MLCRWWEVQCLSVVSCRFSEVQCLSVVSFQGSTVSECCVVLREVQCGNVVLLLEGTVSSKECVFAWRYSI